MNNMNYGLYYNKEKLGDILFVIFNSNANPNLVKKVGNCIVLYKNNEIIGYNIFNISEIVKIKSNGFIPNNNYKLIEVINSILKNNNLSILEKQKDSGIVVGEIIDIDEHPESSHLHICQVNINEGKPLQVVCGAFNAKLNLKVVLAKPYSFMPNGQQIIPSKLLGIDSYGMLCSGRELNLPGYENIKGLLELDDSYKLGEDFWGK